MEPRSLGGEPKIRPGCTTDFVRHSDGSVDFALEAIRQMGLDRVELVSSCAYCVFASQRFCSVLTMLQEPMEVRAKLQAHDLKPSQLACHAPLAGPEASEYGLSTLLHAIRFASEVGAPYVSTVECWWLAPDASEGETFAQLRQNLGTVLESASLYEVGVNIETRGPFSRTLRGALSLMELVPGELGSWLGLSFDPGEAFRAGEDPLTFLRAAQSKVRHLHVADVSATSDPCAHDYSYSCAVPLGDGVLGDSIEDCLRLLAESDWRGVASLHVDGIEEARLSADRLRRMLRAVQPDRLR